VLAAEPECGWNGVDSAQQGDGTFQPHRDFGGMPAVSVVAADFNDDGTWM